MSELELPIQGRQQQQQEEEDDDDDEEQVTDDDGTGNETTSFLPHDNPELGRQNGEEASLVSHGKQRVHGAACLFVLFCSVVVIFLLRVVLVSNTAQDTSDSSSLSSSSLSTMTAAPVDLATSNHHEEHEEAPASLPPLHPSAPPPPPVLPFLWSRGFEITSQNRDNNIVVHYPCEGTLYNQFTDELQRYATNLVQTGKRPKTWGQRELPPDTRVLIWGNSHTRQMGLSLIGQHNLKQDVEKVIVFDQNINKNMARRFDLGLNRSVYVVANSYVTYSLSWKRMLEVQIKKRLKFIDAMIVGTFNTCNAPVKTNFAKEMKQISGTMAGVDCDNIEGPNVTTIAQTFNKSIAYASMFATYRHKDIQQAYNEMKQLKKIPQDETNERLFVFMDARRYIQDLGIECGSDSTDDISDCVNNATAARKFHRCTGKHGGHADLLAWDMTEFIWHVKELQQRQ